MTPEERRAAGITDLLLPFTMPLFWQKTKWWKLPLGEHIYNSLWSQTNRMGKLCGLRIQWEVDKTIRSLLRTDRLDKSPSLQLFLDCRARRSGWVGFYYADFISFCQPYSFSGGGTTKSNSNEWPISVPLSFWSSKVNIKPAETVVSTGCFINFRHLVRIIGIMIGSMFRALV